MAQELNVPILDLPAFNPKKEVNPMKTLLLDLRYGLRMLWKSRNYTAVALIALALSIGANSTIFSAVNAVLINPLPYKEPDRLVSIWETDLKRGGQISIAPANYVDSKDQNKVFEAMAAFALWSPNLIGENEPERIPGARVSASTFSLLGVQPLIGRFFSPEEEIQGKQFVVIISHGLWQRRFGSDPGIVGKAISLNGNKFTIVGVMPSYFQFPLSNMTRGWGDFPGSAELWVPLIFLNGLQRDNHYLAGIARLKPGITLGQAQMELDQINLRLGEQFPDTNYNVGMKLVPLREQVVGNVRQVLLILLGAVGFVLLIACVNVANLQIARAATRQKEIAIRMAIGASRWRIVRQLLAESILLAVIGGILGFILALWGIDILSTLSPAGVYGAEQMRIDFRVLFFTASVTILTGILFGLIPALQASRPDINQVIKEGGRSLTAGLGQQLFRNISVVSEIALALILLVGAGLMLKSFLGLQRVDTGFDSHNVLTFQVSLPQTKYHSQKQWAEFYKQVLDRIEKLPGIESAGAVSHLPLSGKDATFSFTIEGRLPLSRGEQPPAARVRAASSDYFRSMGIPLLKGRFITENDIDGKPNVAIISEQMANTYWPGEDPIGKRFSFNEDQQGKPVWREIIGMVKGVRHSGIEIEPGPQMYLPYQQICTDFMTFVVRTRSAPENMTSAVRGEISSVDKEQPVYNIKTMERLVFESISKQRFTMILLSVFSLIALILAAVGIYGVMSYAVSQRIQEIGIRMALGAQRSNILKLVIGKGMFLSLIGIAIGLPSAFGLTKLISSLLFNVSAADPATFLIISLLLAAVSLLACYIPARRAIKIDPIIALRYE
jgi:predicted permease